jgi:hypothetical protein
VFVGVISQAAVVCAQTTIYFTSGRFIRSSVAGTNTVNTIYAHPTDAGRPMYASPLGSSLYWTTYYPGHLRRSDLDGKNVQTLVNQGDTTTRALQFQGGKVYWANEPLGAIYRSNLDGTSVETVISGYTGEFDGIWDFELHGDRIYWVGWSTTKISSIRLDGSDYREVFPAGITRAFSLEIDNNRLIVSDNRSVQPTQTGRILSIALDGTDVQTLVDGPYAVGMDVHGGRVYYGDERTFDISSIPTTGGAVRTELHQDGGRPWQIDVVPEPASSLAVSMMMLLCLTRRR